jgi:hypothetical protein
MLRQDRTLSWAGEIRERHEETTPAAAGQPR